MICQNWCQKCTHVGSMFTSWCCHQMETFSTLLALCAGNSPVSGEFSSQRPVMQSFDVFVDLCLKKWLSQQSRHRWFETLSRSLWRHCNVVSGGIIKRWQWCDYLRISCLWFWSLHIWYIVYHIWSSVIKDRYISFMTWWWLIDDNLVKMTFQFHSITYPHYELV